MLFYVVVNLFLTVIVMCLNAFFFMYNLCLTLNYHTFSLNCIHLHVTLMAYVARQIPFEGH